MSAPALANIPYDEAAAAQAVLARRARVLAEIPLAEDRGRALDVLVCRVGSEEYAMELRLLHGVFRGVTLTQVPCTPPFVAGVLNLRGEILTVLDLAVVFGLPGAEQYEVLLVETPRVRVGLRVAEVLEVRRIELDSLHRGLGGNSFTRGIAQAQTVVLDLEALLADSRFDMPEDTR